MASDKEAEAMRIFMLLPSLSVGGMERAAVTIANGLARRGHDVTVATYGSADDLANELDGNVRFLKKGLKPHPIMRRIPWIRHKFYDDGMWEKRTSPRRLHKYYTAEGPYDVEIGFFRGLSIKAISGFPTKSTARHLAWVHSDFRRCGGYNYEFQQMEDVVNAYRRFDKVVCVSQEALQGFKDVIGDLESTMTIYNPLPCDEIIKLSQQPIQSDTNRHDLNVVIVGHLIDGIKGQRRLIDAVATLAREGIDISLTIVGEGCDSHAIERKIAETDAQSYVTMVGLQRNPYPYIRQADLLVCASYYEGYNLTVAEALIIGTPVMSTRCTGPVEILDNGKYGMIVDNSTEGLTDGLRRLATDDNLLSHYRRMAHQRQDFFNQERILDQIEALF